MRQIKPISEVIRRGSPRLKALREQISARESVLAGVRSALPAELARHVCSAGCESGRLTIGAASSAWASRLRYEADELRRRVAAELGLVIDSVRIKVVTHRK